MIKYQVKIEDAVLSQPFTLDELLDFGLLDDYDEKIMVRAIGESRWVIARNYPFASKEQNCSSNNGFHINDDGTVTRKKKSNAASSSGSSQKGYHIDEYGRVVRTVTPYNRVVPRQTPVINRPPNDKIRVGPRGTTKKEEPEFSFVGCLYILIIIAIIVCVIKFLFLT